MGKDYPKRVSFPKKEQRKFLDSARKKMDLSWPELAGVVGVHKRTMNDWKREETTMSLPALETILKKTGWGMPENVEIKEPFWYVYKGDKSAGGLACIKKYGRIKGDPDPDPEYRKKKWYEWWEREGKSSHSHLFKRKDIREPPKNPKLAEFVGIVLGDGGITSTQVSISLNKENDKEYIKFVYQMFKELFRIESSILPQGKTLGTRVVASSMNLVEFLIKIGLKKGDKVEQQVDIPNWVKQEKRFKIACVRGLVDTDGCVFTHRYQVNGKWYEYKKLAFENHSKPLINSVYKILKEIELNPRMAGDYDLRLDSIRDMKKYFEIINSHNAKHLKRYKE